MTSYSFAYMHIDPKLEYGMCFFKFLVLLIVEMKNLSLFSHFCAGHISFVRNTLESVLLIMACILLDRFGREREETRRDGLVIE
jgi:hypothetical protein